MLWQGARGVNRTEPAALSKRPRAAVDVPIGDTAALAVLRGGKTSNKRLLLRRVPRAKRAAVAQRFGLAVARAAEDLAASSAFGDAFALRACKLVCLVVSAE